jgi:hypothetical protein
MYQFNSLSVVFYYFRINRFELIVSEYQDRGEFPIHKNRV